MLPTLPYQYGDLEPHIDAKTMEIHHGKHHQAYISKFSAAVEGTSLQQQCVCDILTHFNDVPDDIKPAIRNNGGGHINHALFWQVIGPHAGGEPTGDLLTKINDTFGSFSAFQTAFSDAAATRFGSGWAWLVVDSTGRLLVDSTANQDCPIMEGLYPILGLDVWEHAYYLTYQNRRPDYISAFWNVVNWANVSQYYQLATQSDTSYLV